MGHGDGGRVSVPVPRIPVRNLPLPRVPASPLPVPLGVLAVIHQMGRRARRASFFFKSV
jgi:hypothetical protein